MYKTRVQDDSEKSNDSNYRFDLPYNDPVLSKFEKLQLIQHAFFFS